jgi:hypothetical protein
LRTIGTEPGVYFKRHWLSCAKQAVAGMACAVVDTKFGKV